MGEWQEVPEIAEPDEDAWVPAENATEPAEEPEEEEDKSYFPSFDPKWRQPFEGLAYLGHLTGTVTIPYHSFQVRTLTAGEKIRVIELVQHLENSMNYARAYRAAIAAAGTDLVDGKPLLVGSRKIDTVAQKYQYIVDNWHDFVIDSLFDKINELEGNVIEILKELGVMDKRREVAQVHQAETT